MYDQSYEEYMRNVLGYGNMPNERSYYDMMPQNMYDMNTYEANTINDTQMMDEQLEECYPQIYKMVYPMVQKACMRNTKPITKELIDEMVNEIYVNIEPNDSINVNVNIGNTSKINNVSSERGDTIKAKPEVKSKYVRENREEPVRENRIDTSPKETRQQNFLLNDLIRILVLRELIGRPGRPGRPNNYPPQRPPMRPPYPGPGGRPPIMPRGYEPDYGIYEY